ncbi:Transcription factor GATA-4 [Coemansia sp. RSA 2522]|nr:Transcription factor GATA-4 [Coemansia sp. RSA 637]KAJ2436344.1 Transcription factor GATA-4 [Coemansia sp. RSA 2522]
MFVDSAKLCLPGSHTGCCDEEQVPDVDGTFGYTSQSTMQYASQSTLQYTPQISDQYASQSSDQYASQSTTQYTPQSSDQYMSPDDDPVSMLNTLSLTNNPNPMQHPNQALYHVPSPDHTNWQTAPNALLSSMLFSSTSTNLVPTMPVPANAVPLPSNNQFHADMMPYNNAGPFHSDAMPFQSNGQFPDIASFNTAPFGQNMDPLHTAAFNANMDQFPAEPVFYNSSQLPIATHNSFYTQMTQPALYTMPLSQQPTRTAVQHHPQFFSQPTTGFSDTPTPAPKSCSVCGVTDTPTWRRHGATGAQVCNACGLYYKLHGRDREFVTNARGSRVVKRQPRGSARRNTRRTRTARVPELQFTTSGSHTNSEAQNESLYQFNLQRSPFQFPPS